jgi:hypothetical protein
LFEALQVSRALHVWLSHIPNITLHDINDTALTLRGR